MPRITRLQIRNFRGVRDLDWEVPPKGGIIKGRNGGGKSSTLKAISAALAAQGVGPDAIRLGSDSAEILIDLDAVRVRRAITGKGSSLSVTNRDGDEWRKPQTRLTELLGTAALDPLGFFLAKPEERRRQVLEALPVKVTAEDIERWTDGIDGELDVDLDAHGLEVLEQLRATVYARRTEANKQAKAARAAADAAKPAGPPIDDAPPLAEARAARDAADRRLQDLRGREAAIGAAADRTTSARSRIAELRRQAEGALRSMPLAPTQPELDAADAAQQAAANRCTELRRQLREAEEKFTEAARKNTALADAKRTAAAQAREIDSLKAQADELEATVAAAAPPAIAPEDLEAAVRAVADAKVAVGLAEDAEDQRVEVAQHAEFEKAAAGAEKARLRSTRSSSASPSRRPPSWRSGPRSSPGCPSPATPSRSTGSRSIRCRARSR
jgi:DNA repair exonuclease SbcCD ATPase subunit